jgi:hypothetical protein
MAGCHLQRESARRCDGFLEMTAMAARGSDIVAVVAVAGQRSVSKRRQLGVV